MSVAIEQGSYRWAYSVAGDGEPPQLIDDDEITKAEAIERLKNMHALGSVTSNRVTLHAYSSDLEHIDHVRDVDIRAPTPRDVARQIGEHYGLDMSAKKPEDEDPNRCGVRLRNYLAQENNIDLSDATPLGRRLARGLASGLFDS